ncbi:hypothetical protein [Sinorhizobium chiapasense]|uniref:Uncharacterized protein n=1 Tax=Sinorhizobium chiapasense TaxID=501572 RepID=A0ABZ2BHN7_9HYPH
MDELGRIPPRPLQHEWRHERYSSYDGIGYWVSEQMKGHFNQIVNHLKSTREGALSRALREKEPDILAALADGEKFFEMVVSTYTRKNPYAHVAILETIEPETFVSAWPMAPKSGWYWIGSAINERYKSSFHSEELRHERPWARQVVALLEEEVERFQGFARLRLSRAIPRSIGDADDDDVAAPMNGTVASIASQAIADHPVTPDNGAPAG